MTEPSFRERVYGNVRTTRRVPERLFILGWFIFDFSGRAQLGGPGGFI
jgi:hypothetical protein